MDVINLKGVGLIKVRRNASIRYLRVRMAPGRGIWVSVPLGVSFKQVEKFLKESRDWIIQSRKNMEVYEQDTGVGLKIGAEIVTKYHTLKIAETDEKNPTYLIEGETVTLSIPVGVDFGRIEKTVEQFLLEIYSMECQRYLPKRVKSLADKFGFKYGRISFRNNVSNWGSCSFENNISLNIKLMKLPDEIIDYVILHELCHTIEKNHSADFWKLMKKVCPDYAIQQANLKTYNTRV